MGPTIAKAIVTLDGKTSTVTQFDQWCNYWRLATLQIADGLSDSVHTVTVEISPDQPDRKAVTDQFKNDPKFDPKAYDGTVMNIGGIMLIGEINAER
jgi:hypothetical protein